MIKRAVGSKLVLTVEATLACRTDINGEKNNLKPFFSYI